MEPIQPRGYKTATLEARTFPYLREIPGKIPQLVLETPFCGKLPAFPVNRARGAVIDNLSARRHYYVHQLAEEKFLRYGRRYGSVFPQHLAG